MSAVSSKRADRERLETGLYFNHKTGLYEHGCMAEGIDGKRKWTLTSLHGARNITQARVAKKKRERGVENREIVAPSDVLFADVAAAYIASQEERLTHRENPISKGWLQLVKDDYRRDLSHFEQFGRVDKITTAHIETWIGALKQRVGHSVQKRLVGHLRRMLDDHYRRFGGVSPMAAVAPKVLPKQSKEVRRRRRDFIVPKPQNIYGFLANVQEDYRLIITLVVFTGARISEAIAIRWEDIDFENDRITITNQLVRGEWKEAAKTNAGTDRIAPLFGFLKEELLLRRPVEVAAGRGHEDDFVLYDADDMLFSDHNVLRRVKLAADAADLAKMTTHKLRHWYITTLKYAGVPASVVKDIVGHEDNDERGATSDYTHAFDLDETLAMVQRRCAEIGFGVVGHVAEEVPA